MAFDWKGLVGTVAPWIGAALGGPMGSAAVEVVAGALGLSEKTEDAVKQALSGVTPEQMLALKKADQDFAVKMQELGFANVKDLAQIDANDRDSARKREIEVKDNTPKVLAYGITLGYFLTLVMLYFGDIPTGSKEILYIMLGTLGTTFGGVISYYFGSTNGSAEKSKLLANSTPNKS